MPNPVGSTSPDLTSRLAALAGKLRLLVAGLTGRSLRARFEFDDFVQETFVHALNDPARLPANDAALDRHLALLARHVVIDAARSLRAAKREGDRSAAPLAGSSSGGSSSGESSSDGSSFVSRIVAHAPVRARAQEAASCRRTSSPRTCASRPSIDACSDCGSSRA